MKLRTIATGLCGILCATAFTANAQAYTAITTQWNEIKMSQAQCLRRAEAAIRAAGFTRLPNTKTSRHGYINNYTTAIRCMADVNVVFFIVSGPSRYRTPTYMDKVHSHF